MLGKLDEKQMAELLKRQITGRLACHHHNDIYIVPVNYVYKDGHIYAHSAQGKKIDLMRKNPQVCFEVDDIESIFRWQSVIAWGEFEEVTDENEKHQIMQGLIHRIMPFVTHPSGHPSHGITSDEREVGTKIETIIYKIKISKMTGRFEMN